MKALNYTEVLKSHALFAISMVLSVGVFVFWHFAYRQTLRHEKHQIESYAVVFDWEFDKQIMVVDRVDTLYRYTSLINSGEKVNDIAIQNVVSTRKMQLLEDLSNTGDKEFLLVHGLLDKINVFLMVKDSIRLMENQETLLREDLRRCIRANEQASQKLSLQRVQSKL